MKQILTIMKEKETDIEFYGQMTGYCLLLTIITLTFLRLFKQRRRKAMKQKVIILDLTDCKYYLQLHERIRQAFDFPEWYGCNWDAFWDLLRTDCTAKRVEIIGESTLPSQWSEQLEKMHKVLHRFQHHLASQGEQFEYQIIS